ncbi:HdeA/HdeB family chaperone [Nitratireductor sp. GCM10026969]|uniref:HdeA/HdeB family chaperone n=1 Tax=Nitratireductor sp. GCM10026969 TaxID=3252645 RepID=UPI00360854DC
MKNVLKTSAGVLALLAGSSLAIAQDTGTGATGNQQMAGDVSCAQIVALDASEAERVLYFLAGHEAGQKEAGTGTTAATGTDTSTDTMAGADTGSDATTDMDESDTTAATRTSPNMGTDTDTTASTSGADTSGGASADMESDTMAADDTGTDTMTGTDTTTTAGTTTGTTGSAGGAQQFAAVGYFEIPIESVMTACENAPDSSISDILRQQGGGTNQ